MKVKAKANALEACFIENTASEFPGWAFEYVLQGVSHITDYEQCPVGYLFADGQSCEFDGVLIRLEDGRVRVMNFHEYQRQYERADG